MLGYDAISGASPTGAYPTSDVTTSASGTVTSQRKDSAGAIHGHPQVGGPDLRAALRGEPADRQPQLRPGERLHGAQPRASDAWTLLDGRATLHLGVAFSRDMVSPVSGPEVGQNLPKNTNGYSLGWTWILGERDLADISAFADEPLRLSQRPVQGRSDRNRRQPDTARHAAGHAVPAHHRREVQPLLSLGRLGQRALSLLQRRLVRARQHARRDLQPEGRLRTGSSLPRSASTRRPAPPSSETAFSCRRPTCPPTTGSPRSAASWAA